MIPSVRLVPRPPNLLIHTSRVIRAAARSPPVTETAGRTEVHGDACGRLNVEGFASKGNDVQGTAPEAGSQSHAHAIDGHL